MYDITTTSVCIRFPPKTQGRYHLVHVICCLLTDAWQLKSKHAGSPEKYERKFLIELSRALRHNLDNVMIFLLLDRCRKVRGIHIEDFLYRLGPVSLNGTRSLFCIAILPNNQAICSGIFSR